MKKFITISSIFFLFISCGGTKNLGIFGKSRMKYVLGQDGVTPVPLSESVYMWTFGDTVTGTWKKDVSSDAPFEERAKIKKMLSNSLAFTGAPDEKNINVLDFSFYREKGEISPFIKYKKTENPAGIRLWPVDGIRIENRVYVFYYIISNERADIPFYLKAVGLALWEMPDRWIIGDSVNFKRLKNLFPENYPAFGTSVIERGGYLYTIGHYSDDRGRSPVKIARVKPENIEDGGVYEFLREGGAWTGEIDKAIPLLGDVMGECSLSYNEYLGEYVIIYCEMWTGKIIMVTFDDFKNISNAEKKVVYEPPEITQGSPESLKFYYSAKEIFSQDSDIFAIYINPVQYQPYLLKIDTGLNCFIVHLYYRYATGD